MRVELDDPVAVGPTNSLRRDPGRRRRTAPAPTGRTPRGGILAPPSDFNPERVVVDDLLVPAAGR